MNVSLHCWHARRYPRIHLNGYVHPLIEIFTYRSRETKPVSNWLHGKVESCRNMSPLLKM